MHRSQKNFIIVVSPSDKFNIGRRGLRPNLLQFDEQFMHNVSDALREHENTGSELKWKQLTESSDAYDFVSPSLTTDGTINYNNLSSKWMIVISILHDLSESTSKFFGYSPNPNSKFNTARCIYMGYSNEEPFSRNNTENPRCNIVLTHITTLTNTMSTNSYGDTSSYKVTHDQSVINSTAVNDFVEDENHSLRFYGSPEALLTNHRNSGGSFESGISYDSIDDDDSDMIATNNSIDNSTPISYSDKFNIPRHFLDHVISNVSAAKSDFDLNGSEDEIRSIDDTVYSAFNQGKVTFDPHYGLPLNKKINIEYIVSRYNPEIIQNNIDRELSEGFGIVDSTRTNIMNVYYAMLEYTINPIMAHSNISSIMFVYNSYDENSLLVNGGFIINQIMFHSQSDDISNRKRIQHFKNQLINGIFLSLKQKAGDFVLNAQLDSYGKQIFNLRFNDESQDTDVHIGLNMFSGITSPMIGTGGVHRDNTTSLKNLITDSVQNGLTKKTSLPYGLIGNNPVSTRQNNYDTNLTNIANDILSKL